MNDTQRAFLQKAYSSALSSGHIWPGAAAAEAALESGWGTSTLSIKANNLFGLKKPSGWIGKTISMATREFEHCIWVTVPAVWPVFTSWSDCMKSRMDTLKRVSCYSDALAATTAEQFIIRVSAHWATDPKRADKVLAIYHANSDILNAVPVPTQAEAD